MLGHIFMAFSLEALSSPQCREQNPTQRMLVCLKVQRSNFREVEAAKNQGGEYKKRKAIERKSPRNLHRTPLNLLLNAKFPHVEEKVHQSRKRTETYKLKYMQSLHKAWRLLSFSQSEWRDCTEHSGYSVETSKGCSSRTKKKIPESETILNLH